MAGRCTGHLYDLRDWASSFNASITQLPNQYDGCCLSKAGCHQYCLCHLVGHRHGQRRLQWRPYEQQYGGTFLACGGSTTVTFTYTSNLRSVDHHLPSDFHGDSCKHASTQLPSALNGCFSPVTVSHYCTIQCLVGFAYRVRRMQFYHNQRQPRCTQCMWRFYDRYLYAFKRLCCTIDLPVNLHSGSASTVVLTCPVNTTVAAGQTQAAVNAQFAAWLATASASGGCNGVLTNNNTGAPDATNGGTATVVFTYTSTCAPLTTTCTATFTVSNGPTVILNCPTNTTAASCQTQTAVNSQFAAWLERQQPAVAATAF